MYTSEKDPTRLKIEQRNFWQVFFFYIHAPFFWENFPVVLNFLLFRSSILRGRERRQGAGLCNPTETGRKYEPCRRHKTQWPISPRYSLVQYTKKGRRGKEKVCCHIVPWPKYKKRESGREINETNKGEATWGMKRTGPKNIGAKSGIKIL